MYEKSDCPNQESNPKSPNLRIGAVTSELGAVRFFVFIIMIVSKSSLHIYIYVYVCVCMCVCYLKPPEYKSGVLLRYLRKSPEGLPSAL